MIRQFAASGDGLTESAWDLCIIGAGAAGLALATQFLNTSLRVVILESGLREPDAAADDLNTLASVGLRHDGWRSGRVRSFGGTTRAWGGQLVPFRASELESREAAGPSVGLNCSPITGGSSSFCRSKVLRTMQRFFRC
jgi:choline dehydrogenase-like flavoprotein